MLRLSCAVQLCIAGSLAVTAEQDIWHHNVIDFFIWCSSFFIALILLVGIRKGTLKHYFAPLLCSMDLTSVSGWILSGSSKLHDIMSHRSLNSVTIPGNLWDDTDRTKKQFAM